MRIKVVVKSKGFNDVTITQKQAMELCGKERFLVEKKKFVNMINSGDWNYLYFEFVANNCIFYLIKD